MHEWILQILRCPQCGGSFELATFTTRDNLTVNGALTCRATNCTSWFPVYQGVPRILAPDLMGDFQSAFLNEHGSQLSALGLNRIQDSSSADDLSDVKLGVQDNFGFEWTKYDRFGWDDPVYHIAAEESPFRAKSLMSPDEFRGKLVLDAGCGNGRYSHWAHEYGAQVVGVDLSEAVDAARRNTWGSPNIQIIQGDIFNLPFNAESFDAIFSIGVLGHTGDARVATSNLSKLLKPGGSETVHVYGKGNPVYEIVDRVIRSFTKRLSVRGMSRFTSLMLGLGNAIEAVKLRGMLGRFLRLESHPHCIFDWYGPPKVSHHTYPELENWFNPDMMAVEKTNEPSAHRSGISRLINQMIGSASTVTVKWRKVKTVSPAEGNRDEQLSSARQTGSL